MSLTAPSGWCSPCHSERAHATCQSRITKRQLDGCICEEMGGHIAAEFLAIKAEDCDNGGLTNSAPGGALTPNSQGLADHEGIDL